MRFRKTLTFLILATELTFALSARAQGKSVAPTFRSARADVAASLPRHGGVKPPLRHADLKVSATTPGIDSAKPFTQDQVSNMVRDGFGDESGAKLIEQRGIDFAPTEDFYQTLKAAGASEAFLKALRAAKPPEPASAKKPLNQVQVFALLAGQVPSHRVTMLVQERGIDFEPTDDYLQEVRLAGGEDALISALKNAKVMKPPTADPTAETREAEVWRQAARAAENMEKARHEDTPSATHEAIRVNPDNGVAHNNVGVALANNGDWEGAIAEYREAYILDPRDPRIHQNYAEALDHLWPSLVTTGEGPLPTSWSDTWRFYVYHCSPYDVIWCFGGTDPDDACPGVLEVGDGRIKHTCRHDKYTFDAALSDVIEAKIYDSRVVITLRNGRKTRTVDFVAADRLGHAACPPGKRAPTDALLDAILQAIGK